MPKIKGSQFDQRVEGQFRATGDALFAVEDLYDNQFAETAVKEIRWK